MLRLEKIYKSYNDRLVLNSININFREKELVAILGPSGSGKSTLLNIIAGIEKAEEGDMYLGRENITNLTSKKLDYYRSNNINYIFQNYNLINYLTVKDNLLINSKLKNRKVKKNKISDTLENLDISELSSKEPSKLSGGEQQRVAIARSLICDSRIILADEPTGALDSKNSINIMEILKDLAKEKLVILVTHNEELAKEYASRIIRIKDGKIFEDSNPYEDYNHNYYASKKTQLNYFNALKMGLKNLKKKKVRTYLTVLAFCIGLISLGLVLSLSSGFKKEIKSFEENSLYNYPLIISKEREDINNLFNTDDKEYKEGIINVNDNDTKIITNNIDSDLINKIKTINKDIIDGISYYKDIDSKFNTYSYPNPTNDYFDLLAGNYPKKNNEVLLLVDSNNSINLSFANYLKIKDIPYESMISKTINISNTKLKIVGVVKSNNNYFKDLSGILYDSDIFKTEITDIYIFPKSYEKKQEIKEILNGYNIIDDSQAVINLTKSFVDGISYVLIAFSVISLIVSIIMIAIISYISVLERYKEIGILKTLGGTSKDIKRLFLSENLIIGFMGGFISLELINGLGSLINKYIEKQIGITSIVNLNEDIMIVILGLGIFLSYLAGLIPARIASKKKIADILKTA